MVESPVVLNKGYFQVRVELELCFGIVVHLLQSVFNIQEWETKIGEYVAMKKLTV